MHLRMLLSALGRGQMNRVSQWLPHHEHILSPDTAVCAWHVSPETCKPELHQLQWELSNLIYTYIRWLMSDVPVGILPRVFITPQCTFSLMTQFHEEAVEIQSQHPDRKSLTSPSTEKPKQPVRVLGTLLRLWFRGRLSLRKHNRQGAGSLHALIRSPSRGSPGRALLFAHSLLKLRKALRKHWDWLGLWRSRWGPGKQNKGSSLLLLLVIAHCQSWTE